MRLAVFAGIALALAVPAGLGARRVTDGSLSELESSASSQMPREALAAATSSSWYCAGPRGESGTTPGFVDIANRLRREVRGSVSWQNEFGPPVVAALSVPASSQVALASPITKGSFSAADVELEGGRSSAWQASGGPGGETVGPCSPYTAANWYFAGGDADGEDRLIYLLFNPTATDATASITFASSGGVIADPAYQGLFVPAHALVEEDVSARLFSDGAVGTSVTCRRGSVVAFQVELRPPSRSSVTSPARPAGTGAVDVVLGAPSAGPVWYFPEGTTTPSTPEHLYLYDPGSTASTVRVKVGLDAGEASPLTVSVPADSVADVDMSGQPRIPAGVGESISAVVTHGSPVVAMQAVGTPPPSTMSTALETVSNGGTASPWLSTVLGARVASRHWVLAGMPPSITRSGAGGGAAGGTEATGSGDSRPASAGGPELGGGGGPGLSIAIQNPGRRRVSVSVSRFGEPGSLPGMGHIVIGAGSHAYFGVGVESGMALLITSTGPVVSEEQWVVVGLPGWTASAGVLGSG